MQKCYSLTITDAFVSKGLVRMDNEKEVGIFLFKMLHILQPFDDKLPVSGQISGFRISDYSPLSGD